MYSPQCYSKPYISFDGENWSTITPMYHEHPRYNDDHYHRHNNYYQHIDEPTRHNEYNEYNEYYSQKNPQKHPQPSRNIPVKTHKKKRVIKECCCQRNCNNNTNNNNNTSINIPSINLNDTHDLFHGAIVQLLSCYSDNTIKNNKLADSICDYFDIVKQKELDDYKQKMMDMLKSSISPLSKKENQDEIISAINLLFTKNTPTETKTEEVKQNVVQKEPTTVPVVNANDITSILNNKILNKPNITKAEIANTFLDIFEQTVSKDANDTTKQMCSLFRNLISVGTSDTNEKNSLDKPQEKPSNKSTEQTSVLDNVLDDYIARTSSIIDSINEKTD